MSAPINQNTQIQFISAEELRRVAEMEKEERKQKTVEGMIEQMDAVQNKLDEHMQAEHGVTMMEAWAMAAPGDFFKLQARLKMAQKGKQHTHRIQIGLPMTELDSLPPPSAADVDPEDA